VDHTTRALDKLEAKLTVSRVVAGRLIAAGLPSVRLARKASLATLTAIEGIDTQKATAIRAGQ
jgi:hypothetical protein